MFFSRREFDRDDNGGWNVLLRNQSDKGAVIPLFIILGVISLFFFPLAIWMIQDGIVETFEDFLISLIFLGPLGYFFFVIVCSIVWELFGKEVVACSASGVGIYQRMIIWVRTEIPWSSIVNVSPYDEPLVYVILPTRDPTIRITYKNYKGKNKKFFLGFHLTDKQRETVIDCLQEMLLDYIPTESK